MSVQQEHATSETATLTTTESGGVYQSLFDKINLTPVTLPFFKRSLCVQKREEQAIRNA